MESSNISESNEAWRRLLYLYSKVEPFEIKKLLPQLESKIIISISPEDAWDYIKQLYEIVREDISKNKSILLDYSKYVINWSYMLMAMRYYVFRKFWSIS